MYEPSSGFYSSVIQAQARSLNWHGTLTDSDGTAHTFTAANIASRTGTITRAVASNTEITLGTVYASELKIGLFVDDIGVSRAKLYGGTISLTCTVTAGLNTGDIPCGVFTITEATQKGKVCSITAYDAMMKFEKEYLGVSGIATPYNWASNFATRCGVTLGMSEADMSALPNGNISLTLIWNDDIETYRDALSHLAAAIGCAATINRNGELIFLPFASASSVATVRAGDRFDSDIAHNSFRPRTVYVTSQETGKLTSATSGAGNAYLDIGTNAFLQTDGRIRDIMGAITDTRTVAQMLGNIIGAAANFVSVPVEAEIACDPCLDLMDCVTLTGGEAALGGTGMRITSVETSLGGSTKIKCAGANTAEASTAEERANSNTAGDKDLLMWQSTDMNPEQIVIGVNLTYWGDLASTEWGDLSTTTWGFFTEGGTESIITETTITPLKDWARGLLNFTVNYTLGTASTVTYKVFINNVLEWKLTETQETGKIVKTITTPLELWANTETSHDIKVTMAGVRNE